MFQLLNAKTQELPGAPPGAPPGALPLDPARDRLCGKPLAVRPSPAHYDPHLGDSRKFKFWKYAPLPSLLPTSSARHCVQSK